MTRLAKIAQLEQELAQECTKCINTFSGVPMLAAKGKTLQCRLRTCNRKKHKAKMKELKRLE